MERTASIRAPLTREALDDLFQRIRTVATPLSVRVSDGRDTKAFFFTPRAIRLFHSGGRTTDRIGEILVQHGKLTPENRDELLTIARARGRPLGEQALELCVLRQEDIDAALRLQMEVHLSDLYFWPEAEYEVREGEPSEAWTQGQWEFAVFCDVPELLASVADRYRRWLTVRALIRSDVEVFSRTRLYEETDAGGLDDVQARILALVDGRRRVRDVVRDSQLTSLRVHEVLHAALVDGLIERGQSGWLRAQTRREEVLEEIRTLEEERRTRAEDVDLLARLADAHLAIGDRERSSVLWREIARLNLRGQNGDAALEALRRASQCTPNNYDVCEQMLEIHAAQGREHRLIDEGLELGNLYFRRNLLDRARRLLGHLVYLAPREPRVRRLYALTLLGLGQKKLAVWQLHELAQLLEKRDQPGPELADAYREVLALDPTDRETRRRLDALGETGRRRWPIRAALAAGVLLLAAVAGILVHEHLLLASWPEARADLETLIAANDFPASRRLIAELSRRHGESDVAGELQELSARLELAETRYATLGADADLSLARRLEASGTIPRAIAMYERVARLAPTGHAAAAAARQRAAELTRAEARAAALVAEGEALREKDPARAHAAFAAAVALAPKSESLRRILFPVEVESSPPGAEFYVDGALVGTTPLRADVPWGPETRALLRLDGFEDLPLDGRVPPGPRVQAVLVRASRWRARTEGPIENSPLLLGSNLLVAGRDRTVRIYDRRTGELERSASLGVGGDVETEIVATSAGVVFGTGGGELVMMDPATLAVRWRRENPGGRAAGVAFDPESGVVLAADRNGWLRAIGAETGETRWESQTVISGAGRPIAVGGGSFAFLGPGRSAVVAIRAHDGTEAWRTSLDARAESGLSGGPEGLVLSVGRAILVLDPKTGEVRSRITSPAGFAGSPCLAGDVVLAGAPDRSLTAWPVDGSAPRWRAALPGGVPVGVATGESDLLVATAAGDVVRLDRATGRIHWVRRLGEPVEAAPALSDGTVYVATTSGRVEAIAR